jgi:hypothetical protein
MSCKEGGTKPGEQRFSNDMKQLNKNGYGKRERANVN